MALENMDIYTVPTEYYIAFGTCLYAVTWLACVIIEIFGSCLALLISCFIYMGNQAGLFAEIPDECTDNLQGY